MGADPYHHKMSLSGTAGGLTSEPQEMGLPTSMPAVQLSLLAGDQQPSIRTQYAYVQPTAAPPMDSSDGGLSVPRYVDSNPRPAKSPRNPGHQSVHSGGSITTTDASSEYRYGGGSSYVAGGVVGSNSGDVATAPSSFGSGANAPPTGQSTAPGRDYYPASANTWATTSSGGDVAGGSTTVPYANNETTRPYSFSDHYKSGGAGGAGGEPAKDGSQHVSGPPAYGGGASRGPLDAMNHYSWNTS
jgi:hypothetical protein